MKRSLPEANGEIALEELKRLRTELVIVSDYLLKPVEEEELRRVIVPAKRLKRRRRACIRPLSRG
jgi:two-component SAPR family response regulator